MPVMSNRRQHVRFTLPAMYTPISVKLPGPYQVVLEGHAYNISEGGCRFEVDELIEPGTTVTITLQLPVPSDESLIDRYSAPIVVEGNVVWVDEDEGVPPYRMATTFGPFDTKADRELLLWHLGSGRLRLAA